ncbi:MAG TPA: hypothetical protein PLG73_10760 [Candidatus Sumerlaeota bacterium]|nr:hypothetical protein [Candidatus Sumerlaeota bacterium]
MAFSWTYGDWRLETDLEARRIKLIQHIQEIENLIGGYETQKALDQTAARNLAALQEMLKRREEDLGALEDALGLAPGQFDDQPFVELRPR